MPQISGYILVGLLLGPSGLNLLSTELLQLTNVFVDICLGLILFELGKNFDFSWGQNDAWLIIGGIASCILSFALMLCVMLFFKYSVIDSMVVAAIGVTTSPAIVLLVARELQYDGPVVRRTKGLVAINNVFGLLLFVTIMPYLHYKYNTGLDSIWIQPAYYLFGSAFVSGLVFLVTLLFAKFVGKHDKLQSIMMVALIVIDIGLAYLFNLSVIISLLIYGILIKNFNFKYIILNVEFGYVEDIFFLLLFVIVGASLNWIGINSYIYPVIGLITARFLGQLIPVYFSTKKSGFTDEHSLLVGCALVPMAAISLWITKTAAYIYPNFSPHITQTIIIALLIMQLIGPVITQWAFKRAECSSVQV